MPEPPNIKDEHISSSPLPPEPVSWFGRTKKLGYAAMQGVYAARRFLDTEIVPPAQGSILPRFVSPDDSHKSNLRKIDKLRNIAKRSHEVLVSANTVFPLTIFPDTIIVDRSKITIIKRIFFFTSQTVSIQVEDVLNVSCGLGPFFGSLTISVRVMNSTDHFRTDHFWRHDAVQLKHIIQGFMIAHKNGVDLDQLSREELIEHLNDLGHDSSH